MSCINKVLVVGGGIGGMSAAIKLQELGVQVDLIDIDPNWRVYGAGITITGPTLRTFRDIGILDEVRELAYAGDEIQVCTVKGERLARIPTPMAYDKDLPGSGGIMRPLLHSIMSARTRASGASVRLGVSVRRLNSDAEGVDVELSDGSMARYDKVIGADGVFSTVRQLLFPEAPKPQYTGQCAWRLVIPRPAELDRRHFFLGGPVKLGMSPVSRDEAYMFLLERSPEKRRVDDADLYVELAKLMEPYGGMVADVRKTLSPESRIVMRPLEGFLLPKPWHLGRCILIGDAAHPTTPQLASGAGMAIEDALVLAEESTRAESVEELFERFMARRYERCRLVVENSLEIGRLEQSGGAVEAQTKLVESSLKILAEPY